MDRAVQNQPRRSLSWRCPPPDQPWWADAHCFLPLLFGPLAFLLTVLPGLQPVLEGQSINYAGLFSLALWRLVVFSGVGYLCGYGFHWVFNLAVAVRSPRVDVTVGQKVDSTAPPQPRPQSVAVSLGVEHLEPGMKLADAVATSEGHQLAASGTLLTEEIIEAVKATGVGAVRVEGVKYLMPEGEAGPEPPQGTSTTETES